MRELLEKHIITGDETWEQTTENAVETQNLSCFQEILIMAFSSQDYANSVLGFQRPSVWTLSTSTAHIRDHSNKSWVFGHHDQLFAHYRKEYSVILLHDNACPKTAAHTTTVLQIWNSTILEHPARIPVLTSSDYNLFGPFQEAMRVSQSPDN